MSCVEALDARGLTLRPSPRQDTSPFSEFGDDAEGGPPVLSSPSAISMSESDSTARPNSNVRVSVRTGCSPTRLELQNDDGQLSQEVSLDFRGCGHGS